MNHVKQKTLSRSVVVKSFINPAKINKKLVALLVLLASGCAEKDMADLKQFTIDTRLKYIGKVEALPEITPYQSYNYQVSDKRDPFNRSASLIKIIALKRTSNGINPNNLRGKEDLEKYELENLIMVGVMNNNGQNWAIIKSPDNSIFRVKKGNYVGSNHGKILAISESKIDLKEIIKDDSGGWIERNNKLAISE